jgi:hypothetical protein
VSVAAEPNFCIAVTVAYGFDRPGRPAFRAYESGLPTIRRPDSWIAYHSGRVWSCTDFDCHASGAAPASEILQAASGGLGEDHGGGQAGVAAMLLAPW